jgi:hypothetical protein
MNKPVLKEFLTEISLFVIGTLVVSLFYRGPLVVTVLLVIGGAVALKMWHEKDDVYFLLVGAFLGPLVEIICVSFGAWEYATPHLFGIPAWLFPAWGLFAILVRRIAGTLKKLK